MAVEITIAGDGCALRLRVNRYEFTDAPDYHDANWLVTDVELVAESREGFEITVQAAELLGFRDRLRQAVESRSGSPTFDHLEEQVGCTIAIESDRATLSAFIQEHGGAELRVAGRRMERHQLERALRDLDAAVQAFPVRERPTP